MPLLSPSVVLASIVTVFSCAACIVTALSCGTCINCHSSLLWCVICHSFLLWCISQLSLLSLVPVVIVAALSSGACVNCRCYFLLCLHCHCSLLFCACINLVCFPVVQPFNFTALSFCGASSKGSLLSPVVHVAIVTSFSCGTILEATHAWHKLL